MAEAPAVDAVIKDLGDKIANLTLIQAKSLADYMKAAHGIEPAAGGGIVMAAMPGAGGAAAAPAVEEKTEFNVIIKACPADKKLAVIKVVRAARGDLGLKEAKALVDEAPKPVLEAVGKEEAEKAKALLESAGATVELK